MRHSKLETVMALLLLILSNITFAQTRKSASTTPIIISKDTITVLTFNDFHGAYTSATETPSAAVFVKALEKEKGKNTIVLSAGDNLSGTYFSRITRGEPYETYSIIQELSNSQKASGVLHATRGSQPTASDRLISAIGNHEFDWGKSFLTDTATNVFEYISANIKDTIGTSGFNQKIQPYKILNIPVLNGSNEVHVGIIGVTTMETKYKIGDPSYIKDLAFVIPDSSFIQPLCDSLRNIKKVDIVLLLMHIGTEMKNGAPVISEKEVQNISKVKGIDAIISGHSHKVVLGKINGIPILQAGTNGQYIGKFRFEVSSDQVSNQVRYIDGDTIKVSSTEYNIPIKNAVDKFVEQHKFDSIYTVSKENMSHNRNVNLYSYTKIGTLVAASYVDAYRKEYPGEIRPVIGVNHFNGIRTGLPEGDITRLTGGNVLPFGGDLKAYKFTGKTLKKLLTEGMSTKLSRGFLQSSNIAIEVIKDSIIARIYSVSEDNTHSEIADGDSCVIVCDAYIAKGGDGYSSDLFSDNIPLYTEKETTSAFLSYLNGQDSIPNAKAKVPEIMKGTIDFPYLVTSASDLKNYSIEINKGNPSYADKCYSQTNDIDLKGQLFTPIGTIKFPFKGHYEGQKRKIKNLLVSNNDFGGLFGCVRDGEISNLEIESGCITSHKAGGVCGYMYHSIIKNCINRINVQGVGHGAYVGGICGDSWGGEILNCKNYGGISSCGASAVVGGIAGASAFDKAIIGECENFGEISNNDGQVGGICASNNEGTVSSCKNKGSVRPSTRECGAIVGWNNGVVNNCGYTTITCNVGIGVGKTGNTFIIK